MRILRFGAALVIAAALVVTMAYLAGFGPQHGASMVRPRVMPAAGDPHADFAARLLADTSIVWSGKVAELGGAYPAPELAEFTDHLAAACASASTISGPFYCPRDGKVYIDLAFFRQIDSQFAALADAAKAYVVAHEVGHHVQALLGATEAVQKVREHSTRLVAERAQVAFELQADCYAGIWSKEAASGHRNSGLDAGSADAALRAAATVGEALQKGAAGGVVADPFTHATAEQRTLWFKRGLASGKVEDCNAFAAP